MSWSIAADIYRPAAIQQLKVLGEQLNIPVYSEGTANPVDICRNAMKFAHERGRDAVLMDTAGRLTVDEELMQELENLL